MEVACFYSPSPALSSQALIWFEVWLEMIKKRNNNTEAYKMKQGQIKENFDKFDGSFLENFEELYALEMNKDQAYVRKTISKILVGCIVSLFLTRGLSRKTQLYISCVQKDSKTCKDTLIKCIFCFLLYI